jgi:hypothetical protein
VYEYPVKVGGKPVFENRVTRLRLGERLFEVNSMFSNSGGRSAKPVENFPHEIAIGVVTQNKGAQIQLLAGQGIVSVYEQLDGKGLGTGVVIEPSRVVRTLELPAADAAGKNAQALLLTRPDKEGRVIYRAGFAWAADGEIKTEADWLEYLKGRGAR